MSTAAVKTMPDFCNRRSPVPYPTALNILLKVGVDINHVDIVALGEYENYRGEVQQQTPAPGTTLTPQTHIVLKVGYPSAVDYMPYQLFYGIHGVTARTSAWEDKARALMAPFDAAVIRHDAFARQQALQFSFGMADMAHLVAYLRLFQFKLWRDSGGLDEALLWATLLPSFHFWAGNPRYVTRVLHSLFGYDFHIEENTTSEHEIPAHLQSRLGDKSAVMGETFILGRSFTECDSGYELKVSGVKGGEVEDLLPGKPKRRKLEWVMGICLPNNLTGRIRFKVEYKSLVVGNQREKRFLGYSTYL